MQAVRLMSWVRPKPKPASKLESVKWEEEKPTGPPWKNLKALTREKKVCPPSPNPSLVCCCETQTQLCIGAGLKLKGVSRQSCDAMSKGMTR